MQDEAFLRPTDLRLDLRNPRAGSIEYRDEDDAIRSLIATADIDEIVVSIQTAGWIDLEPLIVERPSSIVLEGNRRLAALRLMVDPLLRTRLEYRLPSGGGVHSAPEQVRIRYVEDRRAARDFIAFKHINGPAKWDAFAKARYASEWLEEGAELDIVARSVGDTHNTVLRLVNGLTVYNQAIANGFDRDDITARQFNFSHLYTALTRPSVRQYLNINDDAGVRLPEAPVPSAAIPRLTELMGWLYGQAKQGREHVVRTQNPDLGKLVRVLNEPRAVSALIRYDSLRLAFDEVEPAYTRFEDSLKSTAVSAEKTLGLVSHFDADKQSGLFETVQRVASSIRVLRDEMRNKLQHMDDL